MPTNNARSSLLRRAFALLMFTFLVLARSSATTAPSAPPAFADAVHVMNGCYISATVYLARFHAEFPAEEGMPLEVHPRNYEMAHTIALVTWEGSWWVRDEYFGVFALGCRASECRGTEELQKRASLVVEKYTRAQVKSGAVDANLVRRQLADAERPGEIDAAARLLADGGERFIVESGGKRIAFIFFRPSAGCIALYNPAIGTATARCASSARAALVVSSLAGRLGYKVDAVHADVSARAGTTAVHS